MENCYICVEKMYQSLSFFHVFDRSNCYSEKFMNWSEFKVRQDLACFVLYHIGDFV